MRPVVRIAASALAAFLLAGAANAQSRAEEEIKKAEETYRLAKLHQDISALDRILADSFNETNQNGNSRNKAQTLDLWKSFSISSLQTDSMEVRMFGNTAMVLGTQTENGIEHMLFTRVYVNRYGEWQLLASMQYRDPRLETAH
jgi:hypothetical protein